MQLLNKSKILKQAHATARAIVAISSWSYHKALSVALKREWAKEQAMKGTTKQVAWAKDIAAQKMQDITKWMNSAKAKLANKASELAKVYQLETLIAKKSADFWIEQRDCYGIEIIKMVSKEIS